MKILFGVLALSLSFASTTSAEEMCYGAGVSKVCVTVDKKSLGSLSITAGEGQNTYSLNSDVYTQSGDSLYDRSQAGTQDAKIIQEWTDAQGHHTIDSKGRLCTTKHDGTKLGC